MIARANRFHGHASLRYVYQHGRVVRGSWLSLKFAPNERRDTYRAAVVVSRKVSKLAVERNRMRRRVYEQIRLAAPRFKGAFDIVFTVQDKALLDASPAELASTIQSQLTKAGILKT